MHILLTNDDGIFAPGIWALYLELKKFARVTVVAPESERSSVGHGITLSHPIWVSEVKRKGSFFGHGITGTPADCVKFATRIVMKTRPDLVVSGINLGSNDGCSVFYSGTVAGAREGAMMGLPALAVSLATFTNPDFRYAARVTRQIIQRVKVWPFPKGTFLNVNVPHLPAARIKGLKITSQGMVPIDGVFQKRKAPYLREYYWMTGKEARVIRDPDVDTFALKKGYVTLTPLQCDLTCRAGQDLLRNCF